MYFLYTQLNVGIHSKLVILLNHKYEDIRNELRRETSDFAFYIFIILETNRLWEIKKLLLTVITYWHRSQMVEKANRKELRLVN